MNTILPLSQELEHIELLEKELKKLPPIEQKLRHFLEVDGIYVRELFIPAGCALVGKVHSTESYSIVTKGLISVVNNFGDRNIMKAGDIVYSKPGNKKAGYAIADTLFVTVHRCDLKDLEEIESYLTVDTIEEYKNRITS
jgi:quercetin dioxygenase-like cupin family protein